ncbi:Hypothetical predicted protein [Podarcis lilfordi]|uniref:Uncharacterized protein n=1 Tax=Podarcis lilfordi TaxID=74358 RepID=A0AA35K5W4_9SAUR|nr:Hypothetical predicted protein [Podarcis lilfordi]
MACLPVTKQTKISEFFYGKTKDTFNIPTSNSFSPLAEIIDKEITPKEPPTKQPNNSLDNTITRPKGPKKAPTMPFQAEDCIGEQANYLSELLLEHSTTLDLVAKTVDCIFKYIRDIKGSLENITSFVAPKVNVSPVDVSPEDRAEPTPRVPALLRSTPQIGCKSENEQSMEDLHAISSYNLSLQATRLCLIILPFKGQVVNWSSTHVARRHLAELLGVDPLSIDLKSTVHIYSKPHMQRILLTFDSKKLPTYMMSLRSYLTNYRIFITRVFINTKICPLIPYSPVKRKAIKNEGIPTTTSSTSPPSDLISWTETPMPLLSKATHLENSMEQELLVSFSHLPKAEQTEITDRLDELLLYLRNFEDLAPTKEANIPPNLERKMGHESPQVTAEHTPLLCPSEIHAEISVAP